MTSEEIAKEILISMIEHDKISPTINTTREDINKSYVEEVCKAYSTVYQTVCNASKSKYEAD